MIETLKETGEEDYPFIDDNECVHKSKKDYLQMNILGFCGCGDPDSVMIYVRDFLQNLDDGIWSTCEDLPYMFLVYWADHNGFSEHGTTARCSWLTEKGKELLNDINWCLENEKE